MRRSIFNEMIVALVVVAVLGFAVAFGVLLSDPQNEEESNGTGTAVAEVTEAVGAESNVGVDVTQTPPDVTPTVTPTPYTIPTLLADLVRGTSFATTVPPLETTPTSPTTTVAPSSTIVNVTPGNFSPTVEATTPSGAPSSTPTVVLETMTATRTASPTRTGTHTATATALPPTASPTLTTSPTLTPFPMETSGILPTPTTTATSTLLSPPTVPPALTTPDAACIPPLNWFTYVVQPGDTLFSIGLSVGSTVNELRTANCLPDVDRITVGDVLYVPRPLNRPVQTAVPGGTTAGLSPVGCTSPAVRIVSPGAGQRISGVFTVTGSATLPDFNYYKLEVRLDDATVYNFIAQFNTPVTDGVLGQIDSNLFNPGVHWVRLTVVDNTGNVPPAATCVIPVIFE